MSRPSPALVVAFLALLASLTGAAVAAIPARDGDVHLCYNPRTGEVEVVDTQRDRFRCPRAWRGFIVDARPTELVSPNRQFRVEATNSGARLVGPEGRVEVGTTKVSVLGDLPVEVTGNTSVSVTGGTDVNTTAGRDLSTQVGRNLNFLVGGTAQLRSLGDLTVQSDNNLELLADERARLRGLLVLIEGLNTFRVEGKDASFSQSGDFDVRASRTTIQPPPNSSPGN